LIISVLAVTIAMTLMMLAAWAVQRALKNGGWTDVFWTYGTGLTCAAAALCADRGAHWRHILVAALVAIWAIRLGTYVALRVASSPEDVRYAYMRGSFGAGFQSKMFGLLIVQGPITGLLSIAIIFAARAPAAAFRLQDLAGIAIMALAIGGETLADRQMKQFKAASKDHQAVCDRGLWAWSRHPNYLFEWLGWFAYPAIGLTSQNPWSLLSLSAPLLMYVVLRYLTGVPPLEAAMLRKKGAAYKHYQETVGVLLPRARPRKL
jgi:steroid 5-alpha reductase family enzyme